MDRFNRAGKKGSPVLTAQNAGFVLKRAGLKKRKAHGTMVIVFDASLLKEAIAKEERSATWYQRMTGALGEDIAISQEPPPESHETVDAPPSVLSAPERGPETEDFPHGDSPTRQPEGTAAVLPAPPSKKCEACGRPLQESETFFGRGGRILCAKDFGLTAAEEVLALE